MNPMRSALRGAAAALVGNQPATAPQDDGVHTLIRSEREVAGVVFERALISEREASRARARAIALADAGVCGSPFDLAIAAIQARCNASMAYACDLVSVIADEAHLPASQPRERFLDLAIPPVAARHGKTDAVTSRDVRRARGLAEKVFRFANDVPNALTRLLGLSGDLPPLLVRLATAPDATSAGAQDAMDGAIDAIAALGRASGPRRATHRDGLFERPALCVSLCDIHPGLEGVMSDDTRQSILGRLSALIGEARRSDVILLLDASDEARLATVIDVFLEARASAAAAGWDGLGCSVAAESKRAIATLKRLYITANADGGKIPVRLVHSATVASDLTWAIGSGIADYPVLVTPAIAATSYIACARTLLSERHVFHPLFDGALPAERAVIEAVATAQPYDLVVAGHAIAGPSQGAGETVGDGRQRIGLEIGRSDFVLAQWRDRAATPRLIAALGEGAAGSTPDSAALAAYLEMPRDPVGAVGLLLDPDDDGRPASEAPATVVSLRAPNARADGSLLAVRDAVDQPGAARASSEHFPPPERVPNAHSGANAHADANANAQTNAQRAQPVAWYPGPHAPQSGWAIAEPATRAACLLAAADALHRHKSELLGGFALAGLTLRHSEAEWLACIEALRSAARHVGHPSTSRRGVGIAAVSSLGASVGRVGIATDASYLFADCLDEIARALAAGNAVTCRVPSGAAAPFETFAGVLAGAGLPDGALTMLVAASDGRALTEFVAGQDVLIVSGGHDLQTRLLRAQAQIGAATLPVARQMWRPSLAIVDGTASLSQAAAAIVASIAAFAGQRRGALRTVFVADDAADALTEELVDRLARLTPGPAGHPATALGPMLSNDLRDAAHAEKLRLMQQASLVFDGELPSELLADPFVSPALFSAVPEDAAIVPDALGPLVGITVLPGDDLAELMAGPLALMASAQPWHTVAVFSADVALYEGIAGGIRAEHLVHDPAAFGTASADGHGAAIGTIAPGRFVNLPVAATQAAAFATSRHRGVVS